MDERARWRARRWRSGQPAVQKADRRQIEQILDRNLSREKPFDVGMHAKELEGAAAEVEKVLVDIDGFQLKVTAPQIDQHGLDRTGELDVRRVLCPRVRCLATQGEAVNLACPR